MNEIDQLQAEISQKIARLNELRKNATPTPVENYTFKMASHGGGTYIREQSVVAGKDSMPGLVTYLRQGEQVYKMNSAVFGPGDLYCSIWHILSLAGVGEEDWTPQYSYWKRPQKMDDGGLRILE